jgi:hypothetical protein
MARKIQALSTVVDRHFLNETYDFVFKGKWYAAILEVDLRTAFAGRKLKLDGVAKRVESALAATMDFSQKWADHFARPLTALVDEVVNTDSAAEQAP